MKKTLKQMSKLLAVALSFLTLMSAMPMHSFAEEYVNYRTQAAVNTEENEVLIQEEMVEYRTEYTKHFRLTDGTYIAATYSEPVHYEKDGEWQEINNSLQLQQIGGKDYYVNTASAERVLLPRQFDGNSIKIESSNGYDISISPIGGNNNSVFKTKLKAVEDLQSVKALVDTVSTDETADVDLNLDNKTSAIKYSDVFDDVDLEYIVTPSSLKESIVVNEKADSYSYSFEADFDDLIPVTLGNGAIGLYEEANTSGEPEILIESPYMYDANGVFSDDVMLSVVSNGDKYTLTVTADAEWINSDDRELPVIVDPSFRLDIGRSQISDTYVDTANPSGASAVLNYDYFLYVGKNGLGKTRTYIKYDLPTLPDCSVVTSAAMVFQQYEYDPGTGATNYINAYDCGNNSWDSSTINWNNQPMSKTNLSGYTVIDYCQFGNNSGNTCKAYQFDITKVAKNWYEKGINNGIMLAAADETTTTRTRLCSSDCGLGNNFLPAIWVTYTNNSGVEDSYTYHTAGSDQIGSISVGDYTGNLVYSFVDASTTGNYFPVSVAHIFDNTRRNENGYYCGTAQFGTGFRLNLYERIIASTVTDRPYKYLDGDGTYHYFKLKKTASNEVVYQDEFYPGRLLTKYLNNDGDVTSFKITDGSNIETTFTWNGFLLKKTDITTGKSMWIDYKDSTAIIESVHDGGGHTISFEYYSNKYLKSITDPAGRTITFTYSGSRLIRITKPTGTTNLTYDTNGCLKSAKSPSGESINLTYYTNNYNAQSSLLRVKTIAEKGSNETEGNKLTFVYSAGQTTITDRYNRTQTLMFDNWGHTVSVLDPDGNGSFYKFKGSNQASGTTNTTNLHLLQNQTQTQATVTNYVTNPDFEDSALSPWTYENTTYAGPGSHSVSTAEKYAGSKSVKLSSTTTNGRYGIQQSLAIPDLAVGKTYTLSAYVKVTDLTMGSNATAGVRVYFGYHTIDNGWQTVLGAPLLEKTNGEWVRLSATITVPSNFDFNHTLLAKMAVFGAVGTAFFDNVQVEEGSVVNDYNLLDNGYFRDSAGTSVPSAWARSNTNTSTDKVVSLSGDSYFSIKGDPNKYKNIEQTVTVSGNAGDKFTFGAWAKADSVPKDGLNGGNIRFFGVRIRFINLDGTEGKKSYYYFEAKTGSLQFLAGEIQASSAYKGIRIALLYNCQQNTAYFGDVQLFKEGCTTYYEYDSKGRIKSATEVDGKKTTYTYVVADTSDNADGRISSVSYPDGTTESYTYDSAKRVQTHTDPTGVKTTYYYDSNGNLLRSEAQPNGSSSKLVGSTSVYTGAYQTGTTDPYGNTTSVSVNTQKGLVNSTTDAKGNVTSYTYNANTDYLLKVQSGDSAVSYSYTNHRLTGIGHNTTGTSDSVQYSLVYDEFGNRDTVKVGGRVLSDNTYAANNGNLLKTTYGNGFYKEFEYDNLDRLTKTKYNGVSKYLWQYSAQGQIGLHKDLVNDMEYRFEYDSAGRLTRSYGTPGTSGTFPKLDYINTYNSKGQLTHSVRKINTANRHYWYSYDTAGRLTHEDIIYGNRDFEYDALSRISSIDVTHNTTELYTRSYNYYTGDNNQTTARIMSESVSGSGINRTWSYSYDENGNLTGITDGNTSNSYAYDALNQLTTANHNGKSYSYTYDKGGNILSKTVEGETAEYSYTDTAWGDLLTAYNGESITYDTIGNPLTYRGMTFTWSGRELSGASANGKSYTYKYNADGLRTQKSVDGMTTYYIYSGDKLVAQKTGNNTIYLEYDSTGSPFLVTYNGLFYYYILNGQGDVIALIDNTGNTVVEYTYDPWGQITSVTGALAGTLGQANPLRYRGYYYDSETGFYYVSSRYYDPEIGRWINADNQIAGVGGEVLGYNMFAYCMNNPVNMSDPTGNWPSWSNLLKGSAWLAVGITAVCVGVSVLTCGVAAPAMVGVAAVTVGAGALTAINGAAEIGEAFTGYNVVRDTVFSGNQKVYDTYANTTAAIAEVGTAVCGGWLKSPSTQTKIADKTLQNVIDNPKSVTKLSTNKFHKIANKSSWEFKPTQNNKGYRALKGDMSIRYNMNGTRFDAAHFGGSPYWVISSAKNGTIKIMMP